MNAQPMYIFFQNELHLNKANSSDTETTFRGLNVPISNGAISRNNYDKQADFNFDLLIFCFWITRTTFCCVYVLSAHSFC